MQVFWRLDDNRFKRRSNDRFDKVAAARGCIEATEDYVHVEFR